MTLKSCLDMKVKQFLKTFLVINQIDASPLEYQKRLLLLMLLVFIDSLKQNEIFN